jgi:hypothetical protein
MVTQTAYTERMAPLPPGSRAGSDGDDKTGICETASPGIPFGRAVSQGALSDQGVIIGGSLAGFRGISLRDVTLDVRNGDAYLPPNNVGVRARGGVWVEPTVAVNAHDVVWFNTVTGTFAKATGTNLVGPIPGAYFMDTCGIGGRSRIYLPGSRAA